MLDEETDQQNLPLVIRLDGGLLSTNLRLESFWAALAQRFLLTIRAVFSLAGRQAALNSIAVPDIALLPVRAEVLALARQAQRDGRRVVLVSSAAQALVESVAEHFGFAGPHFGESPNGAELAARLTEAFGAGGFDYVGHSPSDLSAWRVARGSVVVAPQRRLWARVVALGNPVQRIGAPWRLKHFVQEMRPYQWVKNLLLLFPLLAAHDAAPGDILAVLLAMVAFSFGASSIYILNDLLDLDADRRHPEKRHRPIAAGTLPVAASMLGSLGLGLMAVGLGAVVNGAVAGLIAAYMATTLVYSLRLKRLRWVDLFVLASLFTLRALTGGAASGTGLSPWLVGFIFAVFLTLANVKRLTALARAPCGTRLPGRGYRIDDMKGLRLIAAIAILAALSAFAGYTFSAEAAALYTKPVLLRLVTVPMAIWLARIIYLSQRGEGDYDPIIFVAQDKIGHLIIASGVLLAYLAI